MPNGSVDPDSLGGDALDRWYRRTPDEIEQERLAAAQQRYDQFFNPSVSATAGGQGSGLISEASGEPHGQALSENSLPGFDSSLVDRSNAVPNGAYLELVGNPYNPRLKREWEQKEGRPWPRDERGRSYHVAHKKAIADGGTNTLDNIEPMHPDEHIARHIADGDFARWAKRPGIARAFGGRVAEGAGALGFLSDLLGMFTGRIRTDTFDNFSHDVVGLPSHEDRREQLERGQKAINPNWKPGDPIVV